MKRTADGDGSQSSDAAAKRPRTEPLTTQQIQELAAKAKERAALLLQQGQANAVRPPAGPAGSAGLVPGAAAAAANPVRPGANPIRPSMPSANPIRPPAGMPTMANPVRPSMPVTANPVRPVTAAPAASGGSNAVRPGLGAGPSAGAGAAPSMDLIRQQIAAKQEELRRSLAAKNALAAASRPPVQTPLAAAATSVAAALPSAPHDAATRAKGGLNVEFHPVLMAAMGSASSSTASASSTSAASARAKALNRPIFSTVKANVRMQEEEARRLAEEARAAAAAAKEIKIEREVSLDFKDPAKNPYFDPGIKTASAIAPRSRVKRGFQFVTPGKYIEQGTKQRTEAMLEKLKKDIADTIKKSGIEKEIELVSDQSLRTEAPPAVEWWDAKLLPEESYDKHNPDVPYPQGDQLITNLVQHPVPIAPPAEPGVQAPRAMMLTEKERKKLRRQRREEERKDKLARIRLGLLPPEEPKIKISNMMRVLGREAVLNPTMVEAKVREQMAARKKKHDALIAASKLTDEQRRDKLRNKLLEDTSLLSHVCVFRVKNLSHPQHKFKVDKNAEQYNLTGTAILYTDFSVVIVEGGPKGIKAYKKLMLRRIDWTATKDDDGGADANAHAVSSDDMPNRCDLVWEGEVKERSFRTFRFKALPTEAMIREFLGRINATHYWDAARNYAPDAGDASVRL